MLFREEFKSALQLLRAGKVDAFKQKQQQLESYVIAPYLQQAYLFDRVNLKHRKDIQQFLDEYGDQPVAISLRKKFLRMLARKNQTALFLTYYRPSSDISLQCHWLKFRLKTKENRDDIYSQAEQLWLYGESRPDACDSVFKSMREDNRLSDELIWQRLVLAIKSKQKGLVRYLTSLLSPKWQADGLFAQRVVNNPQRLKHTAPVKTHRSRTAQIAALILSQQIWRDADKGLKLIEASSRHYPLNYSQKRLVAKHVALALASQNHPRANEWLANVPANEKNELLLRWKLAHQLRQQNWKEIQRWLSSTPAPEDARSDWTYWLARAEQELGNSEKANKLLEELSLQRNYYGFLAAAQLGVEPNLRQKNYPFDAAMVNRLASHPAAVKAYELWKLNKNMSARREWNHLKSQLNQNEKRQLAMVSHQWGWHDQSIISLAESGMYDAVNMRFPIAYESLMSQAANTVELDLSLSLAIARKESVFMPDARSHVGAVGLMQLMPYTARYIAQKEKLPKQFSKQLTDPQTNITLGTHYLKYLMDYHKGNTILAAASYNAGKHKVEKWIPQNEQLPADIWIEVVPYKETRSYIKNVLAYQQIYRSLMGREDNYFKQLVAMNISNTP